MGGISIEARGKTKIACWLNFVKRRDKVIATYGSDDWLISPSSKKQGFQEMKRDPEKGEWVLHGRFDK